MPKIAIASRVDNSFISRLMSKGPSSQQTTCEADEILVFHLNTDAVTYEDDLVLSQNDFTISKVVTI